LGLAEIHVSTHQPSLRCYHSAQGAQAVYFFTNEHPAESIDTVVEIPGQAPALIYDAFANRTAPLAGCAAGGRLQFRLALEPYASLVVITGADLPAATAPAPLSGALQAVPLAGPWSLALATAEQYPQFTVWKPAAILGDLSRPEALPAFSGTFRYATTFAWEQAAERVLLDLGELYETAQVWINDRLAGTRICPPYCLEVGDLLHAGTNTLVIEVTNTLVKQQRDFFSRFAQQEPAGLLGPVRLLY
jgi:hypothetical protein